MRDLHLYINEQEVDLGDESLVLYNWSETELSNPSNTQNSFSKVISLKGTKRNNRVFGHLWNLERQQTYNAGDINATRRIPFRITYDGGNIFEEGYCKLQNIKLVGGVYQYEISLFGMIGNFLNNLATNYEDGTEKSLADLHYYYEGDGVKEELDLDFNINVSAVTDAWQHLGWDESKWSVINFANCYNGVPNSLDADKVLIDVASAYSPFITSSITEDGTTYSVASNRTVMKTANKMSKEQVKDMRSYLMTPVVSCKEIIKAICDRTNNSGEYDNGYDVELDPEFFTWTNPYYEKTWMTLPQITSLKRSNTSNNTTETTIYNISLLKKENILLGNSTRYTFNIELPSTLEDWSNFDITLKLGTYFPDAQYEGVFLYLRNYLYTLPSRLNAYGIQAYAITDDATSEYENIIGGGNLVWVTSDGLAHMNDDFSVESQKFTYGRARSIGYTPKYEPTRVDNIDKAKWSKIYGSTYHMLNYTEGESIIQEYKLNVEAPSGTRQIRLVVDMLTSNINGNGNEVYYEAQQGQYFTPVTLTNIQYRSAETKYKAESDYYSNRLITKQNLLKSSYSVKDWLLSYCKLFGLYIWYDIVTNKIHIDTRKTFYQRNTLVNIGDKIALDKDYSIKPVFAENKYYNMTQEQVASDLAEDYKAEFQKVYGMKTIDTGVDLDTSQKELMDLKFKSTIMDNRENQYNYKNTVLDNTSGITPYMCDGISYNLYKDGNAEEDAETKEMTKDSFVITEVFRGKELVSGKTFADILDKPLFQDGDKTIDSSSVLLFQDDWNFDMAANGYYLSDDIPAMSSLNGKPTWLLTKDFANKSYVAPITQMPTFSRYWTDGGKHILFSLDFGSPRKLYIDDTINHEEATLYDRYYGTYYGDLYDVNTKVLNCYFKPTNILSINDLKKFYWYDNSIWRLNKVTDYNPEKPEFVKAEFVKVQDVQNITCGNASTIPSVEIVLDAYSVSATGGTITGYVKCSDYGPWTIGDAEGLYVYPMSASTNAQITIDVPPNAQQEDETYIISVEAGDVSASATITQPAGYGDLTSTSFYVHNDTSQTIRIGATLDPNTGTAYRTIAPGQTTVMVVPIPFDGWYWHYDLVLTDVFENAEAFGYTFTNVGMDTIVGYDMDDFNYNAQNVGANDLSAGTLTISE